MKKTITSIFCLSALVLTFKNTANAQTWANVGSADFSSGSANYTDIAIDPSGNPYVVFQDWSASDTGATVMKYSGGSWAMVGSAGFTGGEAYNTAIAINSSGEPYIAYSTGQYGGNINAYMYSGSSWVNLGTATSGGSNPSIALDGSSNPYVCSYNGFSGGFNVSKYSGGSWSALGSGFGGGLSGDNSMVIDASGNVWVAYINSGASVQKYSGGSWAAVGAANFSAGSAQYISLAINSSGTPYVVYQDNANGDKASVMMYSGGSWTTVGSAGFSAGAVLNTSIAIDASGTPYVTYTDNANGNKATVMKYSSGSWVTVGSAGFSSGKAGSTAIAINSIGTPYVVYSDSASSEKVSVEKFGPGLSLNNINSAPTALCLSPNPCKGIFTINITSADKQDIPVTITNMLGEKVKELVIPANQPTEIRLQMPAGVYFVSAITNEEIINEKIVVE